MDNASRRDVYKRQIALLPNIASGFCAVLLVQNRVCVFSVDVLDLSLIHIWSEPCHHPKYFGLPQSSLPHRLRAEPPPRGGQGLSLIHISAYMGAVTFMPQVLAVVGMVVGLVLQLKYALHQVVAHTARRLPGLALDPVSYTHLEARLEAQHDWFLENAGLEINI